MDLPPLQGGTMSVETTTEELRESSAQTHHLNMKLAAGLLQQATLFRSHGDKAPAGENMQQDKNAAQSKNNSSDSDSNRIKPKPIQFKNVTNRCCYIRFSDDKNVFRITLYSLGVGPPIGPSGSNQNLVN